MYGQERLNAPLTLRYGLTKEFAETFSSLTYQGIELPLLSIRHFHAFIRPFVDAHWRNSAYVAKMRRKHRLVTMADAQFALNRLPPKATNLARDPKRRTVVMPALFVQFALDQLQDTPVILIVSNPRDEAALKGKSLPANISIYDFYQHVHSMRLGADLQRKLLDTLDRLLQRVGTHPVFGEPRFSSWLKRRIIISCKTVKAAQQFILSHPVKVLMDHVEIIDPGTTFALMASRYQLPFLNVPWMLINDRSLIPTRASHYLVWGDHFRDWLEKRGIPPAQIHIVGHLNFEYARQQPAKSPREVRERLGIPEQHLLLTFTTQPFAFAEKVNGEILTQLGRVIHRLPLTLVIRPHPADRNDYSRWISPEGNILLSDPSLTLNDILEATDFLLTIASNTALEAALCGKGVIVLQPKLPYHYEHHTNNFNSHLARAKAGPVVSSPQQLQRVLQALAFSPRYREKVVKQSQQFLAKSIDQKDPASVRVKRLVQELLFT